MCSGVTFVMYLKGMAPHRHPYAPPAVMAISADYPVFVTRTTARSLPRYARTGVKPAERQINSLVLASFIPLPFAVSPPLHLSHPRPIFHTTVKRVKGRASHVPYFRLHRFSGSQLFIKHPTGEGLPEILWGFTAYPCGVVGVEPIHRGSVSGDCSEQSTP